MKEEGRALWRLAGGGGNAVAWSPGISFLFSLVMKSSVAFECLLICFKDEPLGSENFVAFVCMLFLFFFFLPYFCCLFIVGL